METECFRSDPKWACGKRTEGGPPSEGRFRRVPKMFERPAAFVGNSRRSTKKLEALEVPGTGVK